MLRYFHFLLLGTGLQHAVQSFKNKVVLFYHILSHGMFALEIAAMKCDMLEAVSPGHSESVMHAQAAITPFVMLSGLFGLKSQTVCRVQLR